MSTHTHTDTLKYIRESVAASRIPATQQKIDTHQHSAMFTERGGEETRRDERRDETRRDETRRDETRRDNRGQETREKEKRDKKIANK